jgi:uncharacterized oxidoreductase
VITGGESGIGLELAKGFMSQGHQVIAVGKNQEKLDKAKSCCSQLVTILCDVGIEEQRIQLIQKLSTEFPQVNVLINNAAVDRIPPPLSQTSDHDWELYKEEINTNLIAPIHLSILFLPHLTKMAQAMIINVTDEKAFVPCAREPAYSASKAGLHSFTLSLRHQLKDTSVVVVEFIPPAVDTDLLPASQRERGIKPEVFAQSALQQLSEGAIEIGYQNEKIFRASRDELDKIFLEKNKAQDV